ncbi:alpha/beta hydrolase, partial [Streptomyces aureus]|uniref:alpha/beta hydrolase n=1 Tax=Streptomyces aureus TaxID=193461 RepID=UPI003F541A04
ASRALPGPRQRPQGRDRDPLHRTGPRPRRHALVITDEADVLRDEGEQYANKLREAGVDVTSVRVAGMVHDFLLLDSLRDTRAANVARKLAVDALRTALHD